MARNLDSIRSGRGLLPKNLHWYIVALVVAGMVVALAMHSGKRASSPVAKKEEAHQKKVVALVKQAPDVSAIIRQGALQVQPPPKPHVMPKIQVPSVSQSPVNAQISGAADGQSEGGYGSKGKRYERGVKATSPIIVLTGGKAPGASKQESSEEALLQSLSQRPKVPSLSPQDKKILEAAEARQTRSGSVPTAAQPGYLSQAQQNVNWYKQVATHARRHKPHPIHLSNPVPPYTIVQGTPIPAVIVSGIDSDLPGQVIARTTQDMYDTVSGNYLLIPAGSLVYGEYNNSVVMGQDRLAVAFDRIIFPDGGSVRIGGMPGIGEGGKAGVPGTVDDHFWKIFGSSLLIAGVAALVEPNNVTNNIYLQGGSGTDPAGQALVNVTRQIEQRNTRIAPTVKVKAGERFNIIVQHDLELAPYGTAAQ